MKQRICVSVSGDSDELCGKSCEYLTRQIIPGDTAVFRCGYFGKTLAENEEGQPINMCQDEATK